MHRTRLPWDRHISPSSSLNSSDDEVANVGGDCDAQDPDEWADGLLAQWVEQMRGSNAEVTNVAFSKMHLTQPQMRDLQHASSIGVRNLTLIVTRGSRGRLSMMRISRQPCKSFEHCMTKQYRIEAKPSAPISLQVRSSVCSLVAGFEADNMRYKIVRPCAAF